MSESFEERIAYLEGKVETMRETMLGLIQHIKETPHPIDNPYLDEINAQADRSEANLVPVVTALGILFSQTSQLSSAPAQALDESLADLEGTTLSGWEATDAGSLGHKAVLQTIHWISENARVRMPAEPS